MEKNLLTWRSASNLSRKIPLPKDPKVLQKMVLDLTAQLDRESAERHKVETILRELIEARRSRKSEQFPADQLALFATVWDARQKRENGGSDEGPENQDNDSAATWQ